MIAGIGAGIYRDYAELLDIIPSEREVTEPKSSNRKLYEEHYRRFCMLYPILKPVLHESSLDNMYGGG